MVKYQLGAGTVSIHGQKLSPWTGWVAGNGEMSDNVFFKGESVFGGGVGKRAD